MRMQVQRRSRFSFGKFMSCQSVTNRDRLSQVGGVTFFPFFVIMPLDMDLHSGWILGTFPVLYFFVLPLTFKGWATHVHATFPEYAKSKATKMAKVAKTTGLTGNDNNDNNGSPRPVPTTTECQNQTSGCTANCKLQTVPLGPLLRVHLRLPLANEQQRHKRPCSSSSSSSSSFLFLPPLRPPNGCVPRYVLDGLN